MTAPPALALRGIRKHFGSVQALRGADFTLMPGELHALLGENGAGKTTLMHVAYGLARPDAGSVAIAGAVRPMPSPRARAAARHRHGPPALHVGAGAERGGERGARGRLAGAPAALRERVRALAERVGLPLEPDAPAGRLSVGLKQRLEIVKALATDARILLLDEPTAVLAPGEAEELLRVVRAFTARAAPAVLITHKLDEALAAADRVTVLRQGVVVLDGPVAGGDAASRSRAAMIGRGAVRGRRPVIERGAGATRRRGDAGRHSACVRLEDLEVPRDTGYGIAVRRATLVHPRRRDRRHRRGRGERPAGAASRGRGPAAPAPRPPRGGAGRSASSPRTAPPRD